MHRCESKLNRLNNRVIEREAATSLLETKINGVQQETCLEWISAMTSKIVIRGFNFLRSSRGKGRWRIHCLLLRALPPPNPFQHHPRSLLCRQIRLPFRRRLPKYGGRTIQCTVSILSCCKWACLWSMCDQRCRWTDWTNILSSRVWWHWLGVVTIPMCLCRKNICDNPCLLDKSTLDRL